jgi:hypothetical protein
MDWVRSVFLGALGSLTVPAMMVAFVGICISGFNFMSRGTSLGWLAICSGVFLAFWAFRRQALKKYRQMLEDIEAKEGLTLDRRFLLGDETGVFFIFDLQAQKLAVCNTPLARYQIKPFQFVRRWYYEHGYSQRSSVGLNINGQLTNNTKEVKTGFTFVVEVSDPAMPVYRFPMNSEQAASDWVARMGALVNG